MHCTLARGRGSQTVANISQSGPDDARPYLRRRTSPPSCTHFSNTRHLSSAGCRPDNTCMRCCKSMCRMVNVRNTRGTLRTRSVCTLACVLDSRALSCVRESAGRTQTLGSIFNVVVGFFVYPMHALNTRVTFKPHRHFAILSRSCVRTKKPDDCAHAAHMFVNMLEYDRKFEC